MIINFLHAFHKLMSIHHQRSELQCIFNSRLYHKHHKGASSTGYIIWYKEVYKK